jgi:hypothetical protein
MLYLDQAMVIGPTSPLNKETCEFVFQYCQNCMGREEEWEIEKQRKLHKLSKRDNAWERKLKELKNG